MQLVNGSGQIIGRPSAPQGDGGASGISSWDMHGGHMGMGNAFSNGTYGMGWCLPSRRR